MRQYQFEMRITLAAFRAADMHNTLVRTWGKKIVLFKRKVGNLIGAGGGTEWLVGSSKEREVGDILFVLDQSLYPKDQFSTNFQHLLGIVPFCHFIKEFDDVSKVHVVVQDDVPIELN